jgi:outer membrane lipoprotein-sorting protein
LFVLASLALLLSLAGCSGVLKSDPELPSGDEAAEQFSSVDVYNATLVYETQLQNQTITNTIERTIRPATGERYDVVTTDGTRRITVSNGTTTWTYTPADNEVTVISLDGSNATTTPEQIRQLVESVEREETNEVLVAPILPPIPGTAPKESDENSTTQMDIWTDPVEVTYDGVETVAGRETHVITMETVEGAENQMEQTMYLDAEHYVPLQAEWNIEVNGTAGPQQTTGSMRVEAIDFDPAVDDTLFEFEPPENATVSTPGQDIRTFESYDAIVAESDRPVPDPEVPSDFEFGTGSLTSDTVSIGYANETAQLFISRRTTGELTAEAEQIDWNGRTYHYDEQFGSNTVQWTCGDAIYSIVSANLDRETLLEIADTVQCPSSE